MGGLEAERGVTQQEQPPIRFLIYCPSRQQIVAGDTPPPRQVAAGPNEPRDRQCNWLRLGVGHRQNESHQLGGQESQTHATDHQSSRSQPGRGLPLTGSLEELKTHTVNTQRNDQLDQGEP
jgi:hypothetical protein